MLKLIELHEAISEIDWINLEKNLNVKLPQTMKEFSLKCNGGIPIPPFVHDKNNLFFLHEFDSISEIEDSLKYSSDETVPIGFKKDESLPFALDEGGSLFSLSLRHEDFGRVYFYGQDGPAEIEGIWESFEEFLDSFVGCED